MKLELGQNLDGEDFRILSRSSSKTGVKDDRVFFVELGLVTEDGVNDCSVNLILTILSEKNNDFTWTSLAGIIVIDCSLVSGRVCMAPCPLMFSLELFSRTF